VARQAPPDDFEAVAPSAISHSPAELNVLFLESLAAGPWGWWVMAIAWPTTEPDGEAGAGTGEEEPGGEFFSDAGGTWDNQEWQSIPVPTSEVPEDCEAGEDEEEDAPLFSQQEPGLPVEPAKRPGRGRGRGRAEGRGKKTEEKKDPKAKGAAGKKTASIAKAAGAEAPAAGEGMRELVRLMSGMQGEMRAVAGRLNDLEETKAPTASEPAFSKGWNMPHASLHLGGRPPPPPAYPRHFEGMPAQSSGDQASALLSQVLQETPAPGGQKPRRMTAQTEMPGAARKVLLVPELDGAACGEDEMAEVTGELTTQPLHEALAMLARNQAAFTTLLADREMGGGSSSTEAMSLKGPGLLLKRRRAFGQNPAKSFDEVTERAGELLHVDEGGSGSLERYGRELVPWGANRLAKRSFMHMAKMHRAAKAGDLPMLKGLIAQGLKFYERVALDHGSQELAVTLLPYEDMASGPADRTALPTAAQDPFAGLADAAESALTLKYISDMAALNKAKTEALKGGGKGKKKGKDKDKDE